MLVGLNNKSCLIVVWIKSNSSKLWKFVDLCDTFMNKVLHKKSINPFVYFELIYVVPYGQNTEYKGHYSHNLSNIRTNW